LRLDNKEAYRHKARQEAEGSPDLDDIFKVIYILRDEFGLHGLADEVIEIPFGGYTTYRRPDIYIKEHGIIIELDGEGIHGVGDEVSEIEKDRYKNYDYKLAEVEVIRINSAKTDGYDREKVILELENHGLKRKKHQPIPL